MDTNKAEQYTADVRASDDFRDTTPIIVPHELYIKDPIEVRTVAADRVTFGTHYIPDNGQPYRIVNEAENGVACKVTLRVVKNGSANEGFVYLFASNGDVPYSQSASVGPVYGFCLGSTLAASQDGASGLSLVTGSAIFATCTPNAGVGALVSVVVEQYYAH